jgi:hypothetical protein
MCILWIINRLTSLKSKSHYDRWSVFQSVLVSSPIWGPRPDFCYRQTFEILSRWGALSDERTSLSFVAVIVSSTWHLYSQVYLSAFYIVICQGSGSLWIHIIYSFICNSSIYSYVCMYNIYKASSSYLTGNILRLHYKAQPVNTV